MAEDDWRQQARLAVLLAASDVSRALDRLPGKGEPAPRLGRDRGPESKVPVQVLRDRARHSLWEAVMKALGLRLPLPAVGEEYEISAPPPELRPSSVRGLPPAAAVPASGAAEPESLFVFLPPSPRAEPESGGPPAELPVSPDPRKAAAPRPPATSRAVEGGREFWIETDDAAPARSATRAPLESADAPLEDRGEPSPSAWQVPKWDDESDDALRTEPVAEWDPRLKRGLLGLGGFLLAATVLLLLLPNPSVSRPPASGAEGGVANSTAGTDPRGSPTTVEPTTAAAMARAALAAPPAMHASPVETPPSADAHPPSLAYTAEQWQALLQGEYQERCRLAEENQRLRQALEARVRPAELTEIDPAPAPSFLQPPPQVRGTEPEMPRDYHPRLLPPVVMFDPIPRPQPRRPQEPIATYPPQVP